MAPQSPQPIWGGESVNYRYRTEVEEFRGYRRLLGRDDDSYPKVPLHSNHLQQCPSQDRALARLPDILVGFVEGHDSADIARLFEEQR